MCPQLCLHVCVCAFDTASLCVRMRSLYIHFLFVLCVRVFAGYCCAVLTPSEGATCTYNGSWLTDKKDLAWVIRETLQFKPKVQTSIFTRMSCPTFCVDITTAASVVFPCGKAQEIKDVSQRKEKKMFSKEYFFESIRLIYMVKNALKVQWFFFKRSLGWLYAAKIVFCVQPQIQQN